MKKNKKILISLSTIFTISITSIFGINIAKADELTGIPIENVENNEIVEAGDAVEQNQITEEGEVKPEEGEVKPEEGEIKPEEGEIKPEEGEIKPEEGEVKPEEGEVKPEEGEVKTEEGEVKPEEGEVKPEEGEVKPEEGEVKPEEGEVKPEEGEVKPEEVIKLEELANIEPAKSPVFIVDQNLKKALNIALMQAQNSEITEFQLSSIEGLNLSNKGIQVLEGIQYCKNLKTLDISGNSIQQIHNLSNLSMLESLNISYNNIFDFSVLQDLTNLKDLNISKNGGNDLSSISALSGLSRLSIDEINNPDLNFLSNLSNLKYLSANSTNLQNLSQITNINTLETFYASQNNIENISGIENLLNLKDLNLSNNRIADIKPIESILQRFDVINLSNQSLELNTMIVEEDPEVEGKHRILLVNPIKSNNLSAINIEHYSDDNSKYTFYNLPHLSKIKISSISNEVQSLSFLEKLDLSFGQTNNKKYSARVFFDIDRDSEVNIPDEKLKDFIRNKVGYPITKEKLINITSLDLDSNEIESLEGLQYCYNLQSFSPGYTVNNLKDVSALSNLKSLTSLSLAESKVTNFDFLKNLVNLKKLTISNITDVSLVKGLVNLEELRLQSSNIDSVAELSNLKKLKILDLSKNNISDINGIYNFTNLEHLHLSKNNISDISGIGKLQNLQFLMLQDNKIENIDSILNLNFDKASMISIEDNKIADIRKLEQLDSTKISKVFLSPQQLDLKKESIKDGIVVIDNPIILTENQKNKLTFSTSDLNGLNFIYDKNSNKIIIKGIPKTQINLNITAKVELDKGTYWPTNYEANIPLELEQYVDEYINIPDLNLKKALNIELNQDINANIKKSQLEKLQGINLQNKGINNLEGLQYCINLKSINIGSNNNPNITILGKLINLESLSADYCNITDINELNSLVHLKTLMLRNNKISNLSGLSNLKNLEELDLGSNKLGGLGSNLNILGDLQNLKMLTLQFNYNITDISFVRNLTKLTSLDVSVNKITDISAVENLTNLLYLNIGGNSNIGNNYNLKNLTNLQSLYLYGLGTDDISGLSVLKNLTNLNIKSNKIKNIDVIRSLPNIVMLDASINQISDIRVLNDCPKLKIINLQAQTVNLDKQIVNDEILNIENPVKFIGYKANFSGYNGFSLQHSELENNIKFTDIADGNTNLVFTQNVYKLNIYDAIYSAKVTIPIEKVSSINVSIPSFMIYNVVTNTSDREPVLASAEYKIKNNSKIPLKLDLVYENDVKSDSNVYFFDSLDKNNISKDGKINLALSMNISDYNSKTLKKSFMLRNGLLVNSLAIDQSSEYIIVFDKLDSNLQDAKLEQLKDTKTTFGKFIMKFSK